LEHLQRRFYKSERMRAASGAQAPMQRTLSKNPVPVVVAPRPADGPQSSRGGALLLDPRDRPRSCRVAKLA